MNFDLILFACGFLLLFFSIWYIGPLFRFIFRRVRDPQLPRRMRRLLRRYD